jgi:hypothetical protein
LAEPIFADYRRVITFPSARWNLRKCRPRQPESRYILTAMRKSLFLLAIPLVFVGLATAQISDDEFKTLMQSNPANVAAIRSATDTAAAAAVGQFHI